MAPYATPRRSHLNGIPKRRLRTLRRMRRGATAAFFAAMLPVVLGVAAFAINVVYMELARTELQIAVDIASRAAGRTLSVTGDQNLATAAADRLLEVNPFANKRMTLQGVDVSYGVSTRVHELQRYSFEPGANPNAVRIQANGTVQLPTIFPTLGVPIHFRPIKTTTCTQSELDMVVMLDASTSMIFDPRVPSTETLPIASAFWLPATPPPPNARWYQAIGSVQQLIGEMIKSHQHEQLAIGYFSDSIRLDVPLTERYALHEMSLLLNTQAYLGGKTDMEEGLYGGLALLSDTINARPWASRVMVVLSDGKNNVGKKAVDAAKLVASQNVMIYTVSFSNEANIGLMEEIATAGYGKHYHVNTGRELADAFSDILKSLPMLLTQ